MDQSVGPSTRRRRGRPARKFLLITITPDGVQDLGASPQSVVTPISSNLAAGNNEPPHSVSETPNVLNLDVQKLDPMMSLIFAKHGDITSDSLFTKNSRVHLLQLTCNIVKELQSLNLADVSLERFQSTQNQIKDLESVRVNIGWLKNKIDVLVRAKEILGTVLPSTTVELHAAEILSVKQKEVEESIKNLNDAVSKVEQLQKHLSLSNLDFAQCLVAVGQLMKLQRKGLGEYFI